MTHEHDDLHCFDAPERHGEEEVDLQPEGLGEGDEQQGREELGRGDDEGLQPDAVEALGPDLVGPALLEAEEPGQALGRERLDGAEHGLALVHHLAWGKSQATQAEVV